MKKLSSFAKRRMRSRTQLRKKGGARQVRLSIHRTRQHIYAQLIDDLSSKTLAASSTLDAEVREGLKNGANIAAAELVGKQIAERAKKAKVTQVKFDRGGFLYHGRVKALADAARAAGLDF
jgi:large subunit ribosomal protein L18